MWRVDGAKVIVLTWGYLASSARSQQMPYYQLLAGKGRRIARRKVEMFENMQRKQKISYESYPRKVVVQPRWYSGVLSLFSARIKTSSCEEIRKAIQPPYTERYVRWCGRTEVD